MVEITEAAFSTFGRPPLLTEFQNGRHTSAWNKHSRRGERSLKMSEILRMRSTLVQGNSTKVLITHSNRERGKGKAPR